MLRITHNKRPDTDAANVCAGLTIEPSGRLTMAFSPITDIAPIAPALKRCPRCGEFKPATLEYFYKGAKWKDGFKPYCKKCQIKQAGEWRRNNRDRSNWMKKKTRDANIERYLERERKSHQRQRQANPEKARMHGRRTRQKYRASIPHQLNNRMRDRVRKSLRRNGLRKNGAAWAAAVGYTAAELRAHLERQFLRGMGWHNIDKWHIDHIVPLASFKFTSTDDQEFKAAWALTNLRPLWKRDNIRKSARRMHLV